MPSFMNHVGQPAFSGKKMAQLGTDGNRPDLMDHRVVNKLTIADLKLYAANEGLDTCISSVFKGKRKRP